MTNSKNYLNKATFGIARHSVTNPRMIDEDISTSFTDFGLMPIRVLLFFHYSHSHWAWVTRKKFEFLSTKSTFGECKCFVRNTFFTHSLSLSISFVCNIDRPENEMAQPNCRIQRHSRTTNEQRKREPEKRKKCIKTNFWTVKRCHKYSKCFCSV